ncbi:MAG: Holliday junction resolvase RuvX [Alphaproteobacteria bacterium]
MPIGLLQDIAKDLPLNVALLGMDVGEKTIGLALSPPDLSMATPLKTIQRTKFTKDIEVLAAVVSDYEVGGFVIGLPLNMDGTEGRRAQSVRDFAAELSKYPQVAGTKPWIAFFDERLSTDAVGYLVEESVDMSKLKAKSRGLLDQLAAQLILQNALNYIRTSCFR